MANYIVYNNKIGEVLRTGSCPNEMMDNQINEVFESVIEGTADDMCDQINLETKKVMKDFKTSRQKIEEEKEHKWIEEAPTREREFLIKQRMKLNALNEAEQELINEGIIT